MKRLLLITVVGVSIPCCSFGDEHAAPRNLYHRVFRQGGAIDHARVRALGASERTQLLSYLRSQIDLDAVGGEGEKFIQGDPRLVEMALLGDDRARDVIVREFLSNLGHPSMSLFLLQDPRTIVPISAGLEFNDRVETTGDFVPFPRQVNTAQAIVHILQRAPEFKPAVREWAKAIQNKYSIGMIRDWYRTNAASMKAGEFEKVEPGDEPITGSVP